LLVALSTDRIHPEVARATVTVVPLRIARGVQNKVLESLAMGKATVVSPPPLEGLRVTPGEHLLLARSPSEWVECLTRLFERPALREQLGAAGRAYTEANHCWERCLAPLMRLLGLSGSHSPLVLSGGPITEEDRPDFPGRQDRGDILLGPLSAARFPGRLSCR
jgi:hypothetical protein